MARPIRSTVCSKAFAVRIGVKIASVSADEPRSGACPSAEASRVCDAGRTRSAIITGIAPKEH